MHMYCINIPYQMPCKIHVPSLKGQNFCDLGSHIARSMTHKRVTHEESTTLALLGRIKMEAERYIVPVRPDRQNDKFSKAIA